MFRARSGQQDIQGSTCRRMQRTTGKEEAILMHTADGLLLAHYKKGCSRICKEVPQLPSASQFDPYPSIKLIVHGHPITLPHLGA